MALNLEPAARLQMTRDEFDARFAAIFSQTFAGIAETDLTGRFVLVNPTYCELVGRSEAELLKLCMQDITHREDLARSLELFHRMIQTGDSFVIEKRYVKPDGSTVWVNNSVSLVRGPGGAAQYALAVAVDRSEHRRALHRSEELARRVVESSADCINVLDLDGHLISMNLAGQKALEICSVGAYRETRWQEWWQGEWHELAQAAVVEARAGGIGTFTGFCPTLSGTAKWWDNTVTPILDAFGRPERLLAVSRDVTRRHIEDHARDVMIETAKATGKQFLAAVAAAMAKIFGTRYAIIAERSGSEKARTLAVYADGKQVADFEYELVNCPCAEVIAGGTHYYEDKVQLRFPGNPLLQHLRVESYLGKPLRGAEGETIGHLAVFDDKRLGLSPPTEAILEIFAGRAGAELERLHSRRTLEERELLLRVVTDHAPMLIAYVDREHRYRFSNDIYHKWFEVAEITGRHVREVVGEEAYQQLLPHLDSALAGNEVSFEDFVPYAGKGRYVRTTYVPHRDQNERVRGLVAIVQDITDRHRADRVTEFLAEANSLLSGSLNYEQTLMQITHLIVPSLADWCAVDVVKDDGALELLAALHWHPEKNQLIREMRERHPLKPDSPVGVPLAARSGQAVIYPSVTEDLLREAAEDDDHFAMLARLSIKSAIIVPLKLRGRTLAVLTLVSGESHYHFSDADLPMLEELARRCALVMENARLYSSAQKEIEVRTRAEIALHEEAQRKDDFLAILGHELRNPLAPMRNCLDILERSDASEEQLGKTRDTIARQVRHMSRLINDLLDVARISQGKVLLERQDFDLVQMLRETVYDHQISLDAKRLHLKCDLPNTPVWINGDPVRISQALINLLRNAESFTDIDGTVSVALTEQASFAVVAVADTGIGMDPAIVATLFRPFSQADRSLDRSRGGLGLGLAVVKGIVELHGGTVQARSAGLGRGSEFALRLPLLGERQCSANEPRDSIVPSRRRVLVIEDNRDVADTMQELLELMGHEVAVGYDGEQGLALARQLAPDIVLCDLGLPGALSGFAVAKALRCEPHCGYLVALTGYGGEQEKARALAAGFHLHLCKPIGADGLEQLFAAVPA
jgi:PAS domain S-box-containing protein